MVSIFGQIRWYLHVVEVAPLVGNRGELAKLPREAESQVAGVVHNRTLATLCHRGLAVISKCSKANPSNESKVNSS